MFKLQQTTILATLSLLFLSVRASPLYSDSVTQANPIVARGQERPYYTAAFLQPALLVNEPRDAIIVSAWNWNPIDKTTESKLLDKINTYSRNNAPRLTTNNRIPKFRQLKSINIPGSPLYHFGIVKPPATSIENAKRVLDSWLKNDSVNKEKSVGPCIVPELCTPLYQSLVTQYQLVLKMIAQHKQAQQSDSNSGDESDESEEDRTSENADYQRPTPKTAPNTSVKETTYYERLEVDVKADENEIRKAYLKLIRKHHPDKVPAAEKAAATEQAAKLIEAYEVFMDRTTRDLYDRYGEEGLKRAAKAPATPDPM